LVMTSGTLTIADVDQNQSGFVAQGGTAGSNGFGAFNLDAAGHWTYAANDAQAAIQQLGIGQTLTDSFTATSLDGTKTQLVTVTMPGTIDVPVITSTITPSINEADPAITLSATYTDPDTTDTHTFTVDTSATVGTVINNNDGTFSYDPNGQFASLAHGQSAT